MTEMKNDSQDQNVIRLLERLKGQESSYPAGLQEKRREAFLDLGVSTLTLGAGLDHIAGEALPQAGSAANLPMTLGMKLTLGFLSTVIVGLSTYLGVTMYENRDAIRDFIQRSTPTLTLVSPSPDFMDNPIATPAYLSTATPSATPSPTGTLTSSEDGVTDPNATSTKPGWHFGQTKTPKPKKP